MSLKIRLSASALQENLIAGTLLAEPLFGEGINFVGQDYKFNATELSICQFDSHPLKGIHLNNSVNTEAVVSPEYSWKPDQLDKSQGLSNAVINREVVGGQSVQTAEIVLNLDLSLYSYRATDSAAVERFLLVSTEGSFVRPSANQLMFDQDDRRGWFTEYVELSMCFPTANGRVVLALNTPPTTSASGSSTVSSSLDFSLSGGFFGKEAMGSASAGGSISSSFSLALEDFQLVNTSSGSDVHHRYQMSMSRGGEFNKPEDLVEQNVGGWITDVFKSGAAPGRLFELSKRATSDLSLGSQALFHAPHNLTDSLALQVSGKYGLLMVEKTFVGVDIQTAYSRATIPFAQNIIVPFGHVGRL